VVPRPLGILGDKFLEVVLPGAEKMEKPTPDDSSRTKPRPEGGRGYRFDFNFFPSAWAADPVTGPSGRVTTTSGKSARVYKQGEVIRSEDAAVTLDDLTRQMGGVSEDLKDISGNVKKLVRNNQAEITQFLHSINRIAGKLERTIDGFDEKQLQRDLRNLSRSVGNVSATLKNLESISAKIDQGEGTLGKLINDPTTANELNRALITINQVVDKARRTLTLVDMSSEYGFNTQLTKTYVSITIQPREDTGYIGQVVIDPRGTKKRIITRENDGTTTKTTDTETNNRTALKYSLQLYKRIGPIAFRLGLFESTGGLGAEYLFNHDQWSVGTEFFDWGREGNNAHLKIFAKFRFWNYLSFSVGGDDLLAKQQGTEVRPSVFAGMGLRFTDEDLKTLLVLQGLP